MTSRSRAQWPPGLIARLAPRFPAAAPLAAPGRDCGCTCDPHVFGHVCGLGLRQSAEVQDRQLMEAAGGEGGST